MKKSSKKSRMNSRIIGGETAKPLEFPWTGSLKGLYKNGSKDNGCGACLIDGL
jgi:hypothetical protein